MKTLKDFINESTTNFKYIIKYEKNNKRESIHTNNKNILNIIKPDWYEIYDANSWNFSEVDSLIEFSGEDSYWYSIMKNSEDPNAPKNSTILRKSELKELKSKYKK